MTSQPQSSTNPADSTATKIKAIIASNPIVLFMKGSADFPQCGFSAAVANILQKLDCDFLDINVLEDPEIRQGIKDYSNWPTIPQLYAHQEFIGGCDIVVEMAKSGELQTLLQAQQQPSNH